MTATTKYGNFNIESQNHKDWVIGHFMEEDSPFKNNNFEIKWGKRKKGYEVMAEVANRNDGKETLAILVYGKMILDFPTLNKIITLEKEGDYFYYKPTIPHTVKAEEDSLIITVRWPSQN